MGLSCRCGEAGPAFGVALLLHVLAASAILTSGHEVAAGRGLNDVELQQVVVFKEGEQGAACIRTPILLALPGNVLLAFGGARYGSCSDYHGRSILVKRSLDDGKSWSQPYTVTNITHNSTLEKGDGINPGSALYQPVDTDSPGGGGVVWFGWVECFHKCTVPYQFVKKSLDGGLSWSEPVDITADIMSLSKFAFGPGYGLYLPYKKRILMCGRYLRTAMLSSQDLSVGATGDRDEENMAVTSDVSETGSACIYSDDNGATWKSGVPVPYNSSDMTPNECQPVTSGGYGEMLMTMRDEHGSDHPLWSRSWDGGESWDDAYEQTNLTSATCDTSMIAVNVSGKTNLLYSHPASSRRENMQVHWSPDDSGAKWTLLETLWPGPAGYSCIAAVQPHAVGVLYENGERGTYERITFAKVEYGQPPAE